MIQKFIVVMLATAFSCTLVAQSLEELQTQKKELEQRMESIKGQLNAVDASIKTLTPDPVWTRGFSGTLGFNFNQLDNWVINANPNSRTSGILISSAAFANLKKSNYFWRNSVLINLGWQKLQLDKSKDEGSTYQPNVDVLQATSLFGYNLTPTIAVSGLGEFRSSVIRNAFNPAYLDLGVGATWKPMNTLVAVFHPLNYNFIFAESGSEYRSSLGCKLVADLNQPINKSIRIRSNLSGFISYEDVPGLSNFTWTNGISFSAWKGLGIGIEYAARINRQETTAANTKDLQSYFILGLSYTLK